MESQADASKNSFPLSDEQGRALLYSVVEKLLANTISVPEFRNEYYDLYLEGISDHALSDQESEFFGLLQEILDWTDPKPDAESRQYGWIDEEQYRSWAKEMWRNFKEGLPMKWPNSPDK